MTFEGFRAAGITDIGCRRKSNEDAILCRPEARLFCVADGMGGGRQGEVASKAIIDSLETELREAGEAWDALDLPARVKHLRAAADRANAWIRRRVGELGFDQMGSTLVAVVLDPRTPWQGVAVHAGDSRLYRFREGALTQITTDHSYVTELGLASDKELPRELRGVLTRGIGLIEKAELEETEFDIRSGDLLLLCSDGLPRMLSDKKLLKSLQQHVEAGPSALAQALIDEAKQAGAEDNVSVVIVDPGVVPVAPPVKPWRLWTNC